MSSNNYAHIILLFSEASGAVAKVAAHLIQHANQIIALL